MYWNCDWFYYKNLNSASQPEGLPEFKDGAATILNSWKDCVAIRDHQDLLLMAQRIGKLVDSGLCGSDMTLSWFTRRVQPLQF